MLKKEQITAVETLLKIPAGTLATAIAAADEVDVAIPDDLTVLTAAELKSRDEVKTGEGVTTGKELGWKEVKKAAGLPDDAPSKDPGKLAEAIANKAVAAAKIPANEKVTELTTQNQLLTTKLQEKDNEILSVKGVADGLKENQTIITSLPSNRSGVLDDDDLVGVIKSKHIKKMEDGSVVVLNKAGEVIRNPADTKPLSLKDGLQKVFEEREGWLSGPGGGGRGGGDSKAKAGLFTKKSEVMAHFEKEGITMQGEKSNIIVDKLAELKKADASFDMDN